MDSALRLTVTTLFGVSFGAYGYSLVAQRRCWDSAVSHLLHLAMSAAMILMAWGLGMNLPAIGVMICSLLAGAWFVRLATHVPWASGDRLTNYYYAVMTAAMAWMYASMSGSLPGQAGHSTGHEPDMMPMPARDVSPLQPGPSWITMVNWLATLGFAAVAIHWTYRWTTQRRINPTPFTARLTYVQMLTQASTAAGTALMFAAMV